MSGHLNQQAQQIVERAAANAESLRIQRHALSCGATVVDFGVDAAGGLAAGIELARICMAGLGDVAIVPAETGATAWPHVQVWTDQPLAACLLSQYAGWQISVGSFFAMGSGAMRAAAAREELFEKLAYRESPAQTAGVLEANQLPGQDVVAWISERTGVAPEETLLCVAPTASQAGTVQVVARSVETALHKLFELGFDVNRVESGCGIAPLAPVAADDLTGIGRTNDAILYGGRVTLWVRGDDESIAGLGPRVPSTASDMHGKPFLEVFEQAGRDFYAIDPLLFSPAEVTFSNLDTGRVQRFGEPAPDVVRRSFGIATT